MTKPFYENHDFDGPPGIIGGNCRVCGGPITEPWHYSEAAQYAMENLKGLLTP